LSAGQAVTTPELRAQLPAGGSTVVTMTSKVSGETENPKLWLAAILGVHTKIAITFATH